MSISTIIPENTLFPNLPAFLQTTHDFEMASGQSPFTQVDLQAMHSIQQQMTTFPLVTLPPIAWGAHTPSPTAASPYIRLRCALLDLLASGSVETASHAAGPYLSFTLPKLWFKTKYALSNGLGPLLAAYGLEPIANAADIASISLYLFTRARTETDQYGPLPHYTISTHIEARSSTDQEICLTTESGKVCPLATGVLFCWPMPDRGGQDIVPSPGWNAVVALIAHSGKLSYDMHGNRPSPAEHTMKMLAETDPLRQLGYAGCLG